MSVNQGKTLFNQLIETTRGLVEIDAQKQRLNDEEDQRKRNEDLTIWIATIGFGLTISGLSAQLKPTAVTSLILHFNHSFIGSISSLGMKIALYISTIIYHAGIGLIFAMLARFLLQKSILRYFKRSQAQK